MSGDLLRQVRIEQSCRRLDRLRAVADEWIGQRHKEDVTGQHATQLDVLRTAVVGPLAELRTIAESSTPRTTVRRIEAIMTCRERLASSVAPLLAVEELTLALAARSSDVPAVEPAFRQPPTARRSS